MTKMGFDSILVAQNCVIDGLCKAGRLDHAIKMFASMEVKDSFTYSSMVHNLCKERRYLHASKVLLACLRDGMKILKSNQRSVIDGLLDLGYTSEARRLKSKIRLAKMLQY